MSNASVMCKKLDVKHWFQTMCVSGDRDTSLSMFKAVRREVRGIPITKRDVYAWVKTTGIKVVYTHTYSDGVREVMFHFDGTYGYTGTQLLLGASYTECMFKLAFKIIAHKWDMSLSQIHEVEAWSFPKASRTSRG